ncbi:putative biotin carboxylase/biotin carboxyl carrier protein [Plesiocystis pacifica SIR-1]|uniref:Putative biotin carboxylase/biotin carboxyl carrier protein n=1 Tax=Plesiocystis pacifica SIR-1 TaxID=391625 RepID=A6G0K9_9BACT|nr:biotin carboxylase N-terminal domain-containing protein [Plesiocystis pacifica]EDM80655.1 putative biotin carboxylase/biotin carboxyl carrier protein [Plesiocystis pacifica SIR-1]
MPAFEKLLIANRGEIAARVIRTARALGYATVAVYSDADADGLAVREADEAIRIGPANAAESYLSVEAILAAAARTGADAIHPGYGFLSENAGFAQACADAEVVFVGPPPAAIEAMGDKARAKARMIEAGVPTVPGYQGDQSVEVLTKEAARIGYPVLLKASAGGGGRGMRRVDGPEQLADAVAGATTEAQNAFGSGELILEKLVEGARHVEIQVFADTHGNAIHLGERDCSAQRRHQKIIEESPCPAVDADLRARMGEAAVAAAKAIGYVGAGTVEFLLGADGAFYFLEMNTRLQVEHPVTEEVTGQDLVAWQLDVAAGQTLPLTQEQVALDGHAIEARLYAEDPRAGFLPQTGPVHAWLPAQLEGVRVDHGFVEGVDQGMAVGSDYDPMVAKVIARGRSREQARRRLIRALEHTVLLGPVTNKAFLADLLAHPRFVAGEVSTQFVESSEGVEAELGARPGASAADFAVAAALWAEGRRDLSLTRAGLEPGWRSAHSRASVLELREANTEDPARVELTPEADGWSVRVDNGEPSRVRVLRRDPSRARARVDLDGLQRDVITLDQGEALILERDGAALRFSEHRPHDNAGDAGSDGRDGIIRAPTMGRVLALAVAAGERVEAGARLLTMEAMKIESTLTTPVAGTITELRAAVGDQVDNGQVLVVLEPEPETAPETAPES